MGAVRSGFLVYHKLALLSSAVLFLPTSSHGFGMLYVAGSVLTSNPCTSHPPSETRSAFVSCYQPFVSPQATEKAAGSWAYRFIVVKYLRHKYASVYRNSFRFSFHSETEGFFSDDLYDVRFCQIETTESPELSCLVSKIHSPFWVLISSFVSSHHVRRRNMTMETQTLFPFNSVSSEAAAVGRLQHFLFLTAVWRKTAFARSTFINWATKHPRWGDHRGNKP